MLEVFSVIQEKYNFLEIINSLKWDIKHDRECELWTWTRMSEVSVQLFKVYKTTSNPFSSWFISHVFVACFHNCSAFSISFVSHLMCCPVICPSREQTILAQSTNAISCWRSTESESRPAESKGTCEQIEEAHNTSTDLIICVVGYKQTAHKEQKEPRKEERIRPFSQVRRAAKEKQTILYIHSYESNYYSSVHKCVKAKCPMSSQESFHCPSKTHLVYLHPI